MIFFYPKQVSFYNFTSLILQDYNPFESFIVYFLWRLKMKT